MNHEECRVFSIHPFFNQSVSFNYISPLSDSDAFLTYASTCLYRTERVPFILPSYPPLAPHPPPTTTGGRPLSGRTRTHSEWGAYDVRILYLLFYLKCML